MCLGGRYGAKTLATAILLFLSSKSFANVGALPAAFEAALGASLMNSGVAEEDARNEAKEVSKWAFGDSETGRKGRFSSEGKKGVSLKKLLSERVVEGVDFTNPEGEKGVIFNIAENGTESDRKLLEKVVNTRFQTQGELVFKRKKRVQQILNFCQQEGETAECEYVVAPDWYSSLELFNYRSKRPVNTDGDYVYSNTPLGMYTGVYYNSPFDLTSKNEVMLDLGLSKITNKNEQITVYSEDYFECGAANNPVCDDPQTQFIEDSASFSNILLSFNYTKQIIDLSPDLITKFFKEAEDERVEEERQSLEMDLDEDDENSTLPSDDEIRASVLPLDPFELKEYVIRQQAASLAENYYTFNYQYPVLKIREDSPQNKNIEDIKDTDTEIDIISTNSGITKEESKDYSVDESSLADIYTGVLRSYVSSNGGGSGGSASSSGYNTPNLFEKYKSDSYFSSSEVGSVIRSLGLEVPRLRDFSDGQPDKTAIPEELPEKETFYISQGEYTADNVKRNYINARPKISTYGADDDEETRHTPIAPVHTGGGGRVSPALGNGTSTGSGSSTHTGEKEKSGSISGSGASSATNSSAVPKSETVVVDKAAPKEEPEADKSEFFLPTLEDISARDILQPFFDLKNSILSELQFSMPSGDCPRPSVELFGQSYSIEAHCTIFDDLSSVISSFAAALWLILAFRIVFSA